MLIFSEPRRGIDTPIPVVGCPLIAENTIGVDNVMIRGSKPILVSSLPRVLRSIVLKKFLKSIRE